MWGGPNHSQPSRYPPQIHNQAVAEPIELYLRVHASLRENPEILTSMAANGNAAVFAGIWLFAMVQPVAGVMVPMTPAVRVTPVVTPRSSVVAQQGYGNLPAGWISGIDQTSGQTYYYNEQTGQSQWEPPTDMQGGSNPNFGGPVLWRVEGFSGVTGFARASG